jgi:tRNA A-37 threonylcarbamoyl transferase component Bud32
MKRAGWIRVEAGGLRWHLHPLANPAALRPILENPEAWLTDPALHLKHEQVVTVARVPAPTPGTPDLVLRRLNYGKPLHRLRDVFRPTRVLRAFRHAWRLETAGVPTPRALAAAEVRRLRCPVVAYLITEYVPGAVTLKEHLARHAALNRGQVLALADLLARLHNHGYSHRDLQGTNLLLDDRLRPWLIDLDAVRRFRRLSERRAALDLGRLAWEFVRYPRVLRWNARRFLRRYCQQRHLEAALPRIEARAAGPVRERLARRAATWAPRP